MISLPFAEADPVLEWFDLTLGYPGEGPPAFDAKLGLTYAALNCTKLSVYLAAIFAAKVDVEVGASFASQRSLERQACQLGWNLVCTCDPLLGLVGVMTWSVELSLFLFAGACQLALASRRRLNNNSFLMMAAGAISKCLLPEAR